MSGTDPVIVMTAIERRNLSNGVGHCLGIDQSTSTNRGAQHMPGIGAD